MKHVVASDKITLEIIEKESAWFECLVRVLGSIAALCRRVAVLGSGLKFSVAVKK